MFITRCRRVCCIFAATSLASVFALVGLLVCYPYNVEEKLDMYMEENQNIEKRVKDTVEAYLEYEQETYKNLVEDDTLEVVLVKYPQLNSNTLVKSQIEVYVKNNSEIKKLKENKIDKKQ